MYFGIFHKLSTLRIFLFCFCFLKLLLFSDFKTERQVSICLCSMTSSSKVASQGLLSSQRSLGTTAGGR